MANRTVAVTLTADVMGYETAMGRASKATTGVADAGDKASGRLAKTFKAAGTTAGVLFDGAVAGSAVLVKDLAKTGTAYNSVQQNARSAAEVALGSAEAMQKQMAEFDAFASKSPFSKQVLLEAQQQMLGYRVEAEKVVPALDAIQNAVAVQGKGNAEIERGVYALSQMNSMGKYTGETIRDLGVLGIDSASILAERFGVTSAEIRDMASKPGGIPVDQVWDPLVNGMMEKFGGATDKIKKQWDGATDRVKAAYREIGSSMMEPFISKNGGGMAVTWVNDFADAMGAARDKTGMFTTAIVGRAQPALSQITPMFKAAERVIDGITFEQVNKGLDTMGRYAVPIAGVAGALGAMGTHLPILSQLGISINPIAAGMIAMTAASPALRGALVSTWEALTPGVDAGKTLLGILGDLTNQVVGAAAPGLAALGEAGAKGAVALLDLVAAGAPLLGVIVPLVGGVSSLVGVVAKLPAPVLLGVAAFAALRGPLSGLPGMLANATGRFAPFTSEAKRAYNAGLSPLTAGLAGVHAQTGGLGSALKGAGSAIVGAFGGPVMFGVTAALGLLTAALSHQAQKSAEAKQAAKSYADSLDEVSGKATSASRELLAMQALDNGAGADAWKNQGRDLNEYLTMVTNDLPAAKKILDNWKSDVANRGGLFPHQEEARVLGDMERIYNQAANGAQLFADKQKVLGDASKDAAAGQDEANSAADRAAEAMRSSAAAADQARSAMQQYANAARAQVDAEFARQDAQARLNEALEGGSRLTRDANGQLDIYSQTSRGAVEPLMSLVDGINRGALALQDQGATQDELNAYMATSEQLFYDNAVAAGAAGTETGTYGGEVEALAGKLGLIPSHVSTSIDISADTSMGEAELDALIASVIASKGAITIDATDDPALAQLATALGLVEAETGIFKIDSNTDPSTARLVAQLGIINESTGTLKIDANTMEAAEKNRGMKVEIDTTTGTIKINGADAGALSTARALASQISQMTGTITIGAVASRTATVASVEADGGIVQGGIQAFAAGGFRSLPSQAVIQPPAGAGGLVQWAENSTAGEGFIPLAPSKRKRSEQILSMIARGFGGAYVKGVRSFANGAVTVPFGGAPVPAHAGPSQITNDFHINVYGATDAEIVTKIRGALSHFSKQVGAEVRA